jgi:hypothetical protein
MLDWGLTAAALLLFLYAIRTLFVSSKEDGERKQQGLGCGFAIVAAGLWIYVLNRHLDDSLGAIRLGIGVLLILPAIQAIAKPQGARIVRAAGGLLLAVLIAGPVVRDLWAEHGIDLRPASERAFAEKIEALEALRGKHLAREGELRELRDRVKGEIGASGKSWEEVQADSGLLEKVDLIRLIDEELAEVASALAGIDSRLPELREALREIEEGGTEERGTEEASTAGSELDSWIEEMEKAAPLDELPIVEQHVRKMELQRLFEEEFSGESSEE